MKSALLAVQMLVESEIKNTFRQRATRVTKHQKPPTDFFMWTSLPAPVADKSAEQVIRIQLSTAEQ